MRSTLLYTLEEREGFLCIKETFVSLWEPLRIANYWKIMPYAEFTAWFASEDRARQMLGSNVFPQFNPAIIFKDVNGWQYTIPYQNLSTQPPANHTETTPIPEPLQKGRKFPLLWKDGAWYQQRATGLKRCE